MRKSLRRQEKNTARPTTRARTTRRTRAENRGGTAEERASCRCEGFHPRCGTMGGQWLLRRHKGKANLMFCLNFPLTHPRWSSVTFTHQDGLSRYFFKAAFSAFTMSLPIRTCNHFVALPSQSVQLKVDIVSSARRNYVNMWISLGQLDPFLMIVVIVGKTLGRFSLTRERLTQHQSMKHHTCDPPSLPSFSCLPNTPRDTPRDRLDQDWKEQAKFKRFCGGHG